MTPSPSPPLLRSRRAAVAGVAIAAAAFGLGRLIPSPRPAQGASTLSVAPSPDVVMAVRDLARLETTEYHIERVIELKDTQSRLFGLVEAKDALLLVAAGDVVAGIDLSQIRESDVTIDWPRRTVRIALPKADIFSVAIDNERTHVVTRATDMLARRVEALEGRARAEAEASMREGALAAGVLDRAHEGAERAVKELLKALGFTVIDVA